MIMKLPNLRALFILSLLSAGSSHAVDGTIVPVDQRTSLELAVVRVGNCTGTLVRPDWVLTARHCVADGTGIAFASVQVMHDNGQRRAVSDSDIHMHPNPVVDVALLKLPSAINAGQVSSIQFFSAPDDVLKGITVTNYGYGGVPDLARAELAVEGIENYGSMHGSETYNRKYLTIYGSIPGDSGGPSFWGNMIVAVTGGDPFRAYSESFKVWAEHLLSGTDDGASGRFTHSTTFLNNLAPGVTIAKTADVNGDGLDDIVQFNQDSAPAGSVYVVIGTASGFGSMRRWHTSFSVGQDIPEVGDVDGDGMDDIILFQKGSRDVYVALSTGTSFGPASRYDKTFHEDGDQVAVADINGDARTDIVRFRASDGDAVVAFSCGPNASAPGCSGPHQFSPMKTWRSDFGAGADVNSVGDVDGDGLADLVAFDQADRDVFVSLTKRQSCSSNQACADSGVGGACATAFGFCWQSPGIGSKSKTKWHGTSSRIGETPIIADANGDGKDDIVNFETTTLYGNDGRVRIGLSNGSRFDWLRQWESGFGFCKAGEKCLTGRVNGDGRMDIIKAGTAIPAEFKLSLP